MIIQSFIGAVVAFAISWFVFRKYNMGLSRKSLHQQFYRYLITIVLSFVTVAFSHRAWNDPSVVMAAIVSLLWIGTYNILYDKTYRDCSPDYDNRMDIAFGIYLFGWLVGLYSVLAWISPLCASVVVGIIETLLVLIPVVHIGYYILYKTCIDFSGMETIIDTNVNEVIEYMKSFTIGKLLALVVPIFIIVGLCFSLNFEGCVLPLPSVIYVIGTVGMTLFLTYYIWKKKHGVFVRTALVVLYNDVKEYKRTNNLYKQQVGERLSKLSLSLNVAMPDTPHTIIMVIGESACRDYMNVFSPQPWENTPWQSEKRKDERHFVFFDNAFSCATQTVPTLEKALTEKSQYNDKQFVSSCSIVDIAHKAGYKVHWYSNQGHIGAADTPVTLVAETSDVAKWTNQEMGKAYYDSSLMDFLDEVDPTKNNFLVLHLKGSHFNFSNRYPAEYAAKNGLTNGDDVQNYRISLHYTDYMLKSFYDYAKEKLNLAAMVYYSDHGAIPNIRRSPKFVNLQMVKIPLWVYLSDNYINLHPHISEALHTNKEKYFTNDLAYELMCGIFDITSDHFDDTSSLTSEKYKYTKEMLLTDNGRIRIIDNEKLR